MDAIDREQHFHGNTRGRGQAYHLHENSSHGEAPHLD